MRKLSSNISAISNNIANPGSQLIVRAEAMQSLGAGSLFTLLYGMSRLIHEMRDALRHWPTMTWGVKARVPAVSCFVTKQRRRQHTVTCRRTVA